MFLHKGIYLIDLNTVPACKQMWKESIIVGICFVLDNNNVQLSATFKVGTHR